ncbi:MAG: aminopeptidase [Spirochaetaceae bacterium]|nr:aminopeptidase [Spirochaetaceae bacterium]
MGDSETGNKTPGQVLSEKLGCEIKNCWETASPEELAAAESFAENYKAFLDTGKTEREFVALCLDILRNEGFVSIEEAMESGDGLAPGAKVYRDIRGRSLAFAVIGEAPLTEGLRVIGAHVDSPRIDLKTNPLYEDSGLALFDSHYYGGIKHYQWTAIPLALHGLVITKDGRAVNIRVGEEEGEPVFTITDLLPHLAQDQMEKKASDFFSGEDLDILAGSRPYADEKVKEKVKLTVLAILHEKYGMVEEDFAGAEIQFVPAFKARDVGLDRSMIGAYGHDDRCCAYAAFFASLSFARPSSAPAEGFIAIPRVPEKTVVCFLSDKEEVGSMGNTGAQSRSFENFAAYLAAHSPLSRGELALRRVLENTVMLSADVNAAYDPSYAGVYDKKTASHMGKGLALAKYTGRRGKYGGSEAGAAFCRKVQNILTRNGVRWQHGNLGKVDKGGGGTIALYAANLGADVLDCGIPVLSMHSPFEVISKIDLYTAYRGYLAFLKEA